MLLAYPNKLDTEKVISSVNPASFGKQKILCEDDVAPRNFLYEGENIWTSGIRT